jgi:hypothetical protein
MAALAKARSTSRLGAANEVVLSTLAIKQKGGTTIYDGSLVCVDGGYLKPFVSGRGLICAGKAAIQTGQPSVSTVDGDKTVRVEQGVFAFLMGSSGDALADTDIGCEVFASDDQTINKTSGAGARSSCGMFMGLKSTTEAFALVGLQFFRNNSPGNCEEISASGALAPDVRTTRLTVSGTKAYTLADGTRDGQRKTLYCVSAGSTPVGAVTLAHGVTGETVITFGASSAGSDVELEWDSSATKWKVVGKHIISGGTVNFA